MAFLATIKARAEELHRLDQLGVPRSEALTRLETKVAVAPDPHIMFTSATGVAERIEFPMTATTTVADVLAKINSLGRKTGTLYLLDSSGRPLTSMMDLVWVPSTWIGQVTVSDQRPPTFRVALTSAERCVYELLADPQWYSYRVDHVLTKCGIAGRVDLVTITGSLGGKIGNPIGFFLYNNVEYLGLATRKVDYDRDEAAGTKRVVALIKQGAYG